MLFHFYFLLDLIHIDLSAENVSVERRKAIVGTIAFKKGFGRIAK
jgi:hypothetical protein